MDHLCQYADRPLSFILRYLRAGLIPAAIIFCCPGGVGCAVSTQYGVKFWSTASSTTQITAQLAFFVLIAMTGDNLLWAMAGSASPHISSVTYDLRRDRLLTSDRSRAAISWTHAWHVDAASATSNAVYARKHVHLERITALLRHSAFWALVLTVSGPMVRCWWSLRPSWS
jgi:hypothetical protein